MEMRPFGHTDMRVSALGFGGSEIGAERDAGTVRTMLESALDAGLNVVDTAACYGLSEELIGAALAHRRHDFYIFTKCGHASGLATPDWDAATIRDSLDRSLARLQTDYIDLIQLHSCDVATLDRGDAVDQLLRAQEAGKVRYVGYSGDNAAALRAVESGQFDALQTSVNIADQSVLDAVIPLAHTRGMGIIAKRPVANVAWQHETLPEDAYGFPYWKRLQTLRYPFTTGPVEEAVATALRFTLSVPGVATAIVGTRTVGRWQQNAAYAARGALDPDVYAEIRAVWKAAADADWTAET